MNILFKSNPGDQQDISSAKKMRPKILNFLLTTMSTEFPAMESSSGIIETLTKLAFIEAVWRFAVINSGYRSKQKGAAAEHHNF